jgi:hypothetical protein
MAILSPVHDAGQAARRNPGDAHRASVETHHSIGGTRTRVRSPSILCSLNTWVGFVHSFAPFGLSPAWSRAARPNRH